MNKSLRAQVALAELEAMGLTVDDLVVAAGRDRSASPPKRTVAEYLPVVAAGYKPRTRRTCNSYWILMVELIGDRPLDQVTVEDLLAVADVRCGPDDDPLDRHRRTGIAHRSPVLGHECGCERQLGDECHRIVQDSLSSGASWLRRTVR